MSGTIIGFHLGHVGPTLLEGLPGWRYVASPDPQRAAMARPPGRVVLVGYSLGCTGVRETLRTTIKDPDAVVTIDGTHSTKAHGAPVAPSHRELWRALAVAARKRERLWLATTLGSHRYVESLPGGQAFASTGRVLEAALDLPDGALRVPQCIDDGHLHVRSYPSRSIDTDAHSAQLRESLPALWREIVRPYLGQPETSVDETPSPPMISIRSSDPPLWKDPAFALGLRICAWHGFQHAVAPREVPGPKHDPRILAYSVACRRGGSFVGVDEGGSPIWSGGTPLPLGRDEDAWCAAARSAAVLASLLPGEPPPHGLRVSVRELVEDARKAGTLRSPDLSPQPGWAAIVGRNGANPLKGGEGHVRTVIQSLDAGRYFGIGGNETNAMVAGVHARDLVLAWIDTNAPRDVS